MSQTNNGSKELMYYPAYQRFPKTGAESSARIGKMSSMAQCLDEALSEIIEEQSQTQIRDQTHQDGFGGSEASVSSVSADASASASADDNVNEQHSNFPGINIDESFKNNIMNHFGPATSDAFCSQEIHTPATKQKNASAGATASEHASEEPPAGILHGKIKYYNRFGGQWRIVVSDAEIRPRINLNYGKLKKKKKISLKENSRKYVEKEIRNKRRRMENGELSGIQSGSGAGSDPDLPVTEDDGAVKINGDLMILAYDDVV